MKHLPTTTTIVRTQIASIYPFKLEQYKNMVFQRSFIDYIEALDTLRQKPGREDMRRTKVDDQSSHPLQDVVIRHVSPQDKPANQINP